MNSSKRFKKDNDDGDDIIIIDSPTSSLILNEFCQHTDQTTGETCREYYSVICIHCHLSLCYVHVEIHRILLLNERDQLINELNERIDDLNPEKIQKFLIDQFERKTQKKLSFVQQIAMEKLIDLNNIIIQLKELFQPIRIIFKENRSVSLFQIKKIKQTFQQFDENKNVSLILLFVIRNFRFIFSYYSIISSILFLLNKHNQSIFFIYQTLILLVDNISYQSNDRVTMKWQQVKTY